MPKDASLADSRCEILQSGEGREKLTGFSKPLVFFLNNCRKPLTFSETSRTITHHYRTWGFKEGPLIGPQLCREMPV